MPAVPMSYRAIADDLAARIERREAGHRAGDRLPSYAEIARLYSVSVSTAQQAIRVLRERGLVVGVAGRGVYVAERDIS